MTIESSPKLSAKTPVLRVNLLGLDSSLRYLRGFFLSVCCLSPTLLCVGLRATSLAAQTRPEATTQPATQAATQPSSQPPDKPADKKTDPASRLLAAEQTTSLNDPTLRPWHLKLAVQLYDAKGNPSEQGTIEEWWSPDADKRTYTSPSYAATEIRHGKEFYRTIGKPTPPYLLEFLRQQTVHPLPSAAEVSESKPEMRSKTFGTVKLDCIMLDQPIKDTAFPPLGLFPTYCIDPQSDILRLSYEYGNQMVVRNGGGSFQSRSIALDNRVNMANVVAASSHIDALSTVALDPATFVPDSSMAKLDTEIPQIPNGVMAGKIVNKTAPIYPQAAKGKRITGTVLLQARIGTDGHIHKLQVISSPDPSLSISALAAVRQWVYHPYVLNGLPVEVDTQITVHFDIVDMR